MREMKVAIVGSRNFDNYGLFISFFAKYIGNENISLIVSGGAKGADSLAERLAKYWNIALKVFKPDWDKYGKSAGFRRNQKIIDACDIVVAFWDGKSRGTKDSLDKAKLAKKPTFIVYF